MIHSFLSYLQVHVHVMMTEQVTGSDDRAAHRDPDPRREVGSSAAFPLATPPRLAPAWRFGADPSLSALGLILILLTADCSSWARR